MRLGLTERVDHGVQVGPKRIFSADMEEVLYAIPELFLKQYHLVKKKIQPQEKAIVRVEAPSDSSLIPKLKERVIAKIKDEIGVEAEVDFLGEGDERFVAAYKFLRVITE